MMNSGTTSVEEREKRQARSMYILSTYWAKSSFRIDLLLSEHQSLIYYARPRCQDSFSPFDHFQASITKPLKVLLVVKRENHDQSAWPRAQCEGHGYGLPLQLSGCRYGELGVVFVSVDRLSFMRQGQG